MPEMPEVVAAMMPVRMKPLWATAEYASIRLTSRWVTAATVPTAMVRIATAHSAGRHWSFSSGTATYVSRISAPNAAILVAAAMNAVIGVGAPW